jgi:hypothetical protein
MNLRTKKTSGPGAEGDKHPEQGRYPRLGTTLPKPQLPSALSQALPKKQKFLAGKMVYEKSSPLH